jgi:hypothetical protein
MSQFDEVRSEALLTGIAPTAGGPLAAAFRAGVEAAQCARDAPRAQPEVSAHELGALLAPDIRDSRLRLLAARALLHLAAAAVAEDGIPAAKAEAKAALHEALAGGPPLKGLIASAITAEDVGAEIELLRRISLSPALFPPKHGLIAEDILPLGKAAAAVALLAAADDAPDTQRSLLLELLRASNIRVRVGDASTKYGIHGAFATVVESAAAFRASFALLRRFPKTDLAGSIASFLWNGANNPTFCTALLAPEVGGVASILDAISSTEQSIYATRGLLGTISNACGQDFGERASRAFAEGGVFESLQPPLLSSDPSLSTRAAFTAATLAVREELATFVEKADLAPVMLDVLRAAPFGAVAGTSTWGKEDQPNMIALLSASDRPVLQLACLHQLVQAVANASESSKETNIAFVKTLLDFVRVAASSPDAFVYSGACFLLVRLLRCAAATTSPCRASRLCPFGTDVVRI